MAEYAGQAIVHALVAALVVEALVRLWRVEIPDLRLAFRLLVLAFPLLVLPAFFLLAPARGEEWFRERWAIFVGGRWGELGVRGVGVGELGLALLSGMGVTLFLRDLLPFLAERLRGRALSSGLPWDGTGVIARELPKVAGAMGLPAPPILLLDRPAPVLLCAGVLRPTLVLSGGTLEMLDERELSAALAHEVAHLARRDAILGWLLIAARAVMFFNPVVQVVARRMVQEMEWRADDLAAAATGDPLALASGLVKLFRAGEVRQAHGHRRVSRLARLAGGLARARAAAIEKRCRRLLDRRPSGPVPLGRARLALTGFALSVLLFFVV